MINLSDEQRERLLTALQQIRAARAPGQGGQNDVVGPRLKERMTIEKFDKSDVLTPGVEGLTPFETIVVEDGEIIEHRRTPEGG